MRARLIVENGEATPAVCDLPAKEMVRLGRNRRNTIVLQDRHASRFHAIISPEEGGWILRDCNTTNGTRLNGERISSPTRLENGQEIAIGDARLRFTVDPSKEDTAEMPVPDSKPLVPAEEPKVVDSADVSQSTTLHADELTALFRFLTASLTETTPGGVVRLALETVRKQTLADTCGYLSLDAEDPEFRVVLPDQAAVDVHLSKQLTAEVQRTGRTVWLLGSSRAGDLESESLLHIRDALCVPLRGGPPAADGQAAPLGALHVYKANRSFNERELRFCDVLASSLANALHVLRSRRALEADNSRLRVHSSQRGDGLIGDSPAMAQVGEKIGRIAPCPCTVLVVGESGVGKELVALALHRKSQRHEGPLVPVNCAAISANIPESELFGHIKGSFTGATDDRSGYFLQADEGTLFLDEIGELSLEIQAMLLRVLETKSFRPVGGKADVKVDVRIVAATNRDLEREVREGRFRRDLFYRLTATIEVPPLRDHLEDIPALAEHFLETLAVEYKRRVSLSEAALERLKTYTWPGNVRQLRSVLETAVAMAPGAVIHAGDLHLTAEPGVVGEPPASLNLEELEAWAIRRALTQTNDNNTQAARLLGINRDTLIAKRRRYNIERKA